MLSLGEKRRFSYLHYTSYLLNTQVLFTKIEIFFNFGNQATNSQYPQS